MLRAETSIESSSLLWLGRVAVLVVVAVVIVVGWRQFVTKSYYKVLNCEYST